MLNGAFALLERSLRIDARSWSTHLARFGLMGAIYISLCFALTTAFMLGAPGLHFFSGIAYLDATFMTLLGIGFFSTSITEEKEEDTLGLMLMAGISPLGILVGKSGGRLWQSLLLIAIQYPFVLLSVTMGGVMGSQVWAVTVALLAYMIFLAGFGLLCSTLAPRSQNATGWMIAGLVLYLTIPFFANEWCRANSSWYLNRRGANDLAMFVYSLTSGISQVCIFLQMNNILATGFGESSLTIQVVSNVLAGLFCAGMAWLLFGIATRDPATETTTRGLVPLKPRSTFSNETQRFAYDPFRTTGSNWKNPFVWKDFHFVAGGARMLLIRFTFFGAIAAAALMIEDPNVFTTLGWVYFFNFLLWLAVTIDAARVLSRSMHDEVKGQTLAALMMLPRSPVEIVYSKFAGALIGWLPGPIIGLVLTFASPTIRKGFWDIVNEQHSYGLILPMFVLYFALIPHIAAMMSLYVRWGAVALAIGITFGLYFAAVMIIILFATLLGIGPGSPAPSPPNFQIFLLAFIIFLEVCVCATCHIAVLLRVQALAAK